jgi:putative transcriptional regulator
VTQTRALYVVAESSRESVDGTAIVEEAEMEGIEFADELRDLLEERGANVEPA